MPSREEEENGKKMKGQVEVADDLDLLPLSNATFRSCSIS
jgi:hypothetical protein